MLFSLEIAFGVAGGIVLAYIFITRGRAIMSGLAELIEVVVAIGGLAFMAWGIFALGQAGFDGSSIIGKIVRFFGMMLFVVVGFLVFVFAGFGMRELYYMVSGRPKPPEVEGKTDDRWIKWSFLNVLLVAMLDFTCEALGLNGWIYAVNGFGRAHGMDDGLTVAMFGLVLLWPWAVIAGLKKAFPDKYRHGKETGRTENAEASLP